MFSYLTVLLSYRRFIFLNFVGVCVIVAIISLFLPQWYRATITILPPQTESLNLGIASSLLGAASGLGSSYSLPLMATPSDIFAAILKSRTVTEAVVEKENLMTTYKVKSKDAAIKELSSRVAVNVTSEGLITLSYEDRDRNRTADVANCFMQELDRVNRETSSSKAKNARIFIEERLAQTQKDLSSAEENLQKFQENNKTLVLDDQMKSAIQKAVDLKAEMVSSEIDLNVLGKTMSPAHPQIQSLRSRINEIKRQLELMEWGNQKEKPEDKTVLDVFFNQVPSLSLQLARLIREVKIQETVFELLTQQYEQYKIEENKDTPTVQVLDKAVPPERRARPKRAFLVAISGILSLFASVALIFGQEYIKISRKRNTEGFKRLETLLGVWRKDVEDLRKKLTFRSRKKNK
ncbi:MAG TPA: GNVR domain-containing protein, partial [candidate division Zixibacteria bacterium]